MWGIVLVPLVHGYKKKSAKTLGTGTLLFVAMHQRHQVRVKPWMALVAGFSLMKLMGAFVPPLQVGDGNAFSRHGCVCYADRKDKVFWTCCKCIYANCVMCVCFVCRWLQQDCRAPLSVLNLALKLCCLAFFSTWSCREKAFSIFLIHYMFFYSSIFALELKKDLRPRLTQSRAWDIKVWQIIVSVSGLVVATIQAVRAFRDSPAGKIRAAVAKTMKPFEPTRKEDEVIKRPVMDTIKNRIKSWRCNATIIGGRFQSGKSVAVEEAWRGVRGVVRFTIKSADWEKVMCKRLKVDDEGMFVEVMSRAHEKLKDFPDNLTKYPILLLDISRRTTVGQSVFSFGFVFCRWCGAFCQSCFFVYSKCFCPFLLARN